MKRILLALIILLFASQVWAEQALLITSEQCREEINEVGDLKRSEK